MRWYYFLIRIFVLSHMICTIGCNGNNETIKILYEDQNEEASKTATAFIDFTEAYEDALDSLNSLEPDDPNIEDVLDDIYATLGPLADDMVASTTNLISLEEQIQSALVSTQVIKPGGFVTGTLGLLTLLGGAAAAGKGVVDVWGECSTSPQLPDETVSAHAARILECIVSNAPQASFDAIKAVVVTLGETVGISALPHGKVKVAAEVWSAGESVHHVHEFFGVKQDGCSPQDNPRIQNSVPINGVAAALQDDISPGDLYIAQSDGSDDGVFPFIPEGDWSFLAFTPDHKAKFIPCVHVSADQTTDITIVITPIDEVKEQLMSIVGTWNVTKYDYLCQGFYVQTGELFIYEDNTYKIDLNEGNIEDFKGTWSLKKESALGGSLVAHFYSDSGEPKFQGFVNDTYDEIHNDWLMTGPIVCVHAEKISNTSTTTTAPGIVPELELTYPVGESPKVFIIGWVFGAKCTYNENGTEVDISERIMKNEWGRTKLTI